MSDLISRQDAIEAVATVTMSIHLSNVLCDKLLALPSTDRPTGKWIYGNGNGECSVCHHERQYGWDNYCGNCGAKMRGGSHEHDKRTSQEVTETGEPVETQ